MSTRMTSPFRGLSSEFSDAAKSRVSRLEALERLSSLAFSESRSCGFNTLLIAHPAAADVNRSGRIHYDRCLSRGCTAAVENLGDNSRIFRGIAAGQLFPACGCESEFRWIDRPLT